MKLGRLLFSWASLAVMVIQVALVSSIAAKYQYERAKCPRVWTQAAMFDPSLVMRGRYLSMQLVVDGCQSTLPSAKQAQFPRNADGVPEKGQFAVATPQVTFPAKLLVQNNKLVAIRILDGEDVARGENVFGLAGAPCDRMWLGDPVNFYIADNAQSVWPSRTGQELWVEVMVPPVGPPRPLQLALKENGVWKPLETQ
jgi:hypothetical protein